MVISNDGGFPFVGDLLLGLGILVTEADMKVRWCKALAVGVVQKYVREKDVGERLAWFIVGLASWCTLEGCACGAGVFGGALFCLRTGLFVLLKSTSVKLATNTPIVRLLIYLLSCK